MGRESVLSDFESYSLLQDIVYVMASRNLTSLPLRIIEDWTQASSLDELIDADILITDGKFVQLNTQAYQRLIHERILRKTRIDLPSEISECIGPPWREAKRFLVKCQPRLHLLSSPHNKEPQRIIKEYTHKTAFGNNVATAKPKSLENVSILPVFHEGDYLQYVKVKKAIRYYNPDFVGIEGLGLVGTRFLLSSLFTPRSFAGFPYCVVMKPYMSQAERTEFFTRHYGNVKGVKACITAESDFAVVASSCIGQSIPFFTMGVPEELIMYYFPHFFEIEKEEWIKKIAYCEREARMRMAMDVHALCESSKTDEIERIMIEGRAKTSIEYKKQLLWSENYMASRIYDFVNIAGFESRVVVFVGLCHSASLRQKLKGGSWQHIPPISETVTKTPIGFAPAKIAAYLLLDDPTNPIFVSRIERMISPSPMHAELFGINEENVMNFVKHNMNRTLFTNNDEEIARIRLLGSLREFARKNPAKYEELMAFAVSQIKSNGLNHHS